MSPNEPLEVKIMAFASQFAHFVVVDLTNPYAKGSQNLLIFDCRLDIMRDYE